MKKLEINGPIDILSELKIIQRKLINAKGMKWEEEKQSVYDAKARLFQLLNLIVASK